ncbi:MAG TPA: dihydrolipoamide acetyltransferase family protein [Thermoplasmata archaeon]|jgi:pyruvate dehydrogenase E2 component (dihydrolipoamide acetyltransferase)|nr:dihydrolipoamide acetyltransferase family protein [Thermoplasmata archaeon]
MDALDPGDSMAKEFKLPDIGEGVHEGEITKWLVKEGDPIKEEQLFVEVMTDKVTVQLPSPFTGTVLKLLAKEGEVVRVGSSIIVVGDEGETAPAPRSGEEDFAAVPVPPPATAAPPAPAAQSSGEVLATPGVRRLARELSVDLAAVRGTGPRGRITEEDVRGLSGGVKPAVPLPKSETALPRPATGAQPEERIPVHGIRRRIAEKMQKSKNTAAHFTFVEEVDMTNLVHLRDKMKGKAEKKGVKLTYLPFVIRAVVASLKDHPTLNATMDDDKQEIVVKRYYNIGIATATDAGLIVPVVHEADKKDLNALAKEIERLAEAARTNKLTPNDITGGTFTITSLGALGGIFATPIINWPEVAIVGIHRIEKRPVVHDDQVVVREMMYLTCSFDHRVIDGHVGAAFVESLKEYLEHPALLFVEA